MRGRGQELPRGARSDEALSSAPGWSRCVCLRGLRGDRPRGFTAGAKLNIGPRAACSHREEGKLGGARPAEGGKLLSASAWHRRGRIWGGVSAPGSEEDGEDAERAQQQAAAGGTELVAHKGRLAELGWVSLPERRLGRI